MGGTRPITFSALTLAVAATAAACSSSPTACTAIAAPGIAIQVRDSTTDNPAASGALGIAVDGSYVDTLEHVPTFDPTTLLTLLGAWEREGTYDVTVTRAGYLPWHRNSIVVTGDECHVHTVTIEALLQPSQ